MKKADLEKLVTMGSFGHYWTEPGTGRVFIKCNVCRRIIGLHGHTKDCLKARFEMEQQQKKVGS